MEDTCRQGLETFRGLLLEIRDSLERRTDEILQDADQHSNPLAAYYMRPALQAAKDNLDGTMSAIRDNVDIICSENGRMNAAELIYAYNPMYKPTSSR